MKLEYFVAGLLGGHCISGRLKSRPQERKNARTTKGEMFVTTLLNINYINDNHSLGLYS
jgi:hypothetical protein